jgi:hypothetical protein
MQLEASLARRIREAVRNTPLINKCASDLDFSQPQVGREDKQDETFWNEPPSGHGDQHISGALPCLEN